MKGEKKPTIKDAIRNMNDRTLEGVRSRVQAKRHELNCQLHALNALLKIVHEEQHRRGMYP